MESKSIKALLEKGIRPSPQRLAVYEALVGRKDHPSADTLFNELRPTMPTMSKTTVLNTMRLFQSAGLIRDVRCEEGELRFDGCNEFHAHFKCRVCGAIIDIPVEAPHKKAYAKVPDDFVVDDEQLIYYGICKKCNATKNKKGKNK